MWASGTYRIFWVLVTQLMGMEMCGWVQSGVASNCFSLHQHVNTRISFFLILTSPSFICRAWGSVVVRRYAPSRKVPESIPGHVTASDKSMCLGSTQPGGKGGRCVGVTTLPPSCAECLEIWEPLPPGPL